MVSVNNHNLKHEKAILEGLLADNSAIDEIKLTPRDFYDKKNAEIYAAIQRVIESGNEADYLTVVDTMGESPANAAVLSDLHPGTRANIKYFVDSVKELSRMRQLEMFILRIKDALATQTSSSEVIEGIEKELTAMAGSNSSDIKWLRDDLHATVKAIEESYKAKGKYTGIETGFKYLDALTSGFQNGELVIIGARPSVGKTAIALTMASNMVKLGITVGFFSCEMSSTSLTRRLIASESKLNLSHVRAGTMNHAGFSELVEAGAKLREWPLLIDDTPNINFMDLKTKARKMKRQGAQILFCDYLTLIRHGKADIPRHERVGEVAKGLKSLARELDIPIVALSQVGRDAEGKMPNLANIRQSGEIEEDADVVIFLHRERSERETRVSVVKNRNGATDSFGLVFIPEYVRFENIA
jgi:replicative DNA helicase